MANGYTHLLVGRDTADGQWFADHPAPDGLAVATRFDDGQLFAVAGDAASDTHGNHDGILFAGARWRMGVAMDGSGRGMDHRERQRSAGRRYARP